MISHEEQKSIWEKEHAEPFVLPQMDSAEASSGIVLFWEWLERENINLKNLRGIEMGCGKGRNCLWLAQQGVKMAGFDFSENAIKVAWQRMNSLAVRPRLEAADFVVHDATLPWPWLDNSFDFAIDCFASTDIESEAGRALARDECRRVLKPGGYLLVYTLSDDDQFHKKTIKQSPGPEKNSLLHPNGGKFEKVFDEDEIKSYYDGWLWREQKRIPKKVTFFGKEYDCLHWWLVLQKI